MKHQIRTPAKELALIRGKLGYFSTEARPKDYLDLGDQDANNVLGHPKLGIAYGRLIEISGPEQSGKSAIAIDLLAAAQADGAIGIWVDAENSFDNEWASKRGVNINQLRLVAPYVGRFPRINKQTKKVSIEKVSRMISAQEMLTEAEEIIKLRQDDEASKMFLVVDSVTALLTREEAETSLSDQGFKSNMSLPAFMGKLLRRWVGRAQAGNVTMVFINQLRTNPMQMFGNPEYTPGGKALKFYCHIRVGMRRVKGGRVMHNGHQVGIKGYLKNFKNKVGGLEQSEVGYHINFSGDIEFLPVSQVRKET